MPAYAYVWLVMGGDRYVPGVITSAYSVLKTKPNADLVVMVTPDVSPDAVAQISKLATVHTVEYITFAGKFNHADPLGKYNWIDKSYTKWRCLSLKYDKILLLDADIIVTRNIDEVFDFPAPAGIFQQQKPLYNSVLSRYLDKQRNLPEKTTLLPSDVVSLLKTKNQLLATATSMLLEPTGTDHFVKSITELKDHSYPNTTGVDEQAIAYYMSVVCKKSWTVLGTKYNAVPWWKYNNIVGSKHGKVLHYMTKEKPWERDPKEYPELLTWSFVQAEAYAYISHQRDLKPQPGQTQN